jgi:Pyruvate/2-oxoacid:ferredoxin oxidoreductase gamma subunit
VLAGAAGQKVRSSGTILCRAAILSGLFATQRDDFPITVMTGHSVSEINLSPNQIHYTGIDSHDYILVFAEEGASRIKNLLSEVSEKTTLVIDDSLPIPVTKAKTIKLPLDRYSSQISKTSLPSLILATLIRNTSLIPIDALKHSIEKYQKAEVVRNNLKAIELGYQLMW